MELDIVVEEIPCYITSWRNVYKSTTSKNKPNLTIDLFIEKRSLNILLLLCIPLRRKILIMDGRELLGTVDMVIPVLRQ